MYAFDKISLSVVWQRKNKVGSKRPVHKVGRKRPVHRIFT